MARRRFSNTTQPTSLTAPVSNSLGATTLNVVSTAGFPSVPFTVAIDRGTADEEACLVTAVTSTTMTVTRGYDSTNHPAHLAGASVEHTLIALDLDEANAHIEDEGRDDHPQYLNEARLEDFLPHVVDNATITDINPITATPQTHALLTVPSAGYDRLVQVRGIIPLLLVNPAVLYNGRILQGASTVVAIQSEYGLQVGGIALETKWLPLASGASAQFRFQISRDSGSAGATSDGDTRNNFSATIIRDL